VDFRSLWQVNDLIVAGNANKVMAIDLGLSERTVEIHRAKVMEKMGVRSVAHLVKLHMSLSSEYRLRATLNAQ
jgi:two-component system, LuxR family, response regulator FixJ